MSDLERKVNLLVRYVISEEPVDRDAILDKLRVLHARTIQEPDSEKSVEQKVQDFLLQLGMPCHILGYEYVVTATCLLVKDPSLMTQICDRLYPEVAKRHNSSKTRVERAIRHALEVAWTRGKAVAFGELFGSSIDPTKGRPTNSEFLSFLHLYASRNFVTDREESGHEMD